MSPKDIERIVYRAYPLGACAGVEWSIRNAQNELAQSGGRQIYGVGTLVNNNLVVGGLEQQGMVFVDYPDQVPAGETALISAHGVAEKDRQALRERGTRVVDSTCPLVEVVHTRVARNLRQAQESGQRAVILYYCKEGDLMADPQHKEIRGVLGEAPDNIVPVTSTEQLELIDIDPRARYYMETQTTLNFDEFREVARVAAARIPALQMPPEGDVCYATRNRQSALREMLARKPSKVLVMGSTISSNTKTLARIAREEYGIKDVDLYETPDMITEQMVDGIDSIGLTAGASVPLWVADQTLGKLQGWGYKVVDVRAPEMTRDEPTNFNRKPKVYDWRQSV